MKSVRLYGPGDIRMSEEPIPIPSKKEALVQVKSVGICGSDLHWFKEGGIGDAHLDHPLVLGHEFSGTTEGGVRVAVDPTIPCGKCEFCLRGDPNLCLDVLFAGHGSLDGGLREYLCWDKRLLFPIPDEFSFDDAAMLEPLGVAIHAVDLAHLKSGMTIGVFGCGPIGLLIIQLALLKGAKSILATDKLLHRIKVAKSFGAKHAFQVDTWLSAEIIAGSTDGRGVDVAFEVAGVQNAVDDAMSAVIPGGKVILVGIPEDDHTAFTASVARRKGLTIKLVRRMKFTYPRAIDLVASKKVDVRSLVSHHFLLSQAAEAFEIASQRTGLKVVIQN